MSPRIPHPIPHMPQILSPRNPHPAPGNLVPHPRGGDKIKFVTILVVKADKILSTIFFYRR